MFREESHKNLSKDEMLRIYRQEGSLLQAGQKLGLSAYQFRSRCLKLGITPNRKGGVQKNAAEGRRRYFESQRKLDTPGFITYIDRQDLVEGFNRMYSTRYADMQELLKYEYKKLCSAPKIGKLLGVSNGTIYNWLREYQVETVAQEFLEYQEH
jgi:hypothetical protein